MGLNIASTGSIIRMYLEANNISALEVSEASGVSLRTVIRVLNDERPLDYDIAYGIHALIPDIEIDFLMNYNLKYQLQKKTIEKENFNVDINKVINAYHLKKLYKKDAGDELKLFEKAKQIFGIDNILDNCKVDMDGLSFCFSLAKGEQENRHLIWLKASYMECVANSDDNLLQFNKESFIKCFNDLKTKTFTSDKDSTIYNMKSFCKKTGINFYYRESIPGARVKATALKDKKNRVFIFVSDLFKCIENLWLAFIHECIHIKNDDFDKVNNIKEDSDFEAVDENYVDEKAILFFVPDYSFDDFTNVSKICRLAQINNAPVNIVMEIARFKTHTYGQNDINKYIHYYK